MYNKFENFNTEGNKGINPVSADVLTIEEVAKKDKKLIEIFKKFDLNMDGQLNTLELAKVMDHFAGYDKDSIATKGYGVLSSDELEFCATDFNANMGLNNKEAIKAGDIQKFINNIAKASSDNKLVSLDDIMSFDKDGKYPLENVVSSAVTTTENGYKYVLKYNDGTEVTVNDDKSYCIVANENNKKVSNFYNSQNQLLSHSVVANNGDISQIAYRTDEHGNSIPETEKIVVKSGVTCDRIYKLGALYKDVVLIDGNEYVYGYAGSQPYLLKKTVNKGTDNEIVTSYAHQNNGIIISHTQEKDKTVVKYMSDIDDEKSIISKVITEQTSEGEKITEVLYLSGNTRLEKVILDNTETWTKYSPENKPIAVIKFVDGDGHYVEYDKDGNTKDFIVKFRETPEEIAKAVGCDVEELLRVNGKGYSQGFMAGERILIPKTLEPDDKVLQNRNSVAAEVGQFNDWHADDTMLQNVALAEVSSREKSCLVRKSQFNDVTDFASVARKLYAIEGNDNPSKHQINLRAKELKELNPDLNDSELNKKEINFRWNRAEEAKVSETAIRLERVEQEKKQLAEKTSAMKVVNFLKDDTWGTLHVDPLSVISPRQKTIEFLNDNLNEDNVVGVIEQYAISKDGKSIMQVHTDKPWLMEELVKNLQKRGAKTAGINCEDFDKQCKIILQEIDKAESSKNNLLKNVLPFSTLSYVVRSEIIDSRQTVNLHTSINNLCKQIRLAESVTQEELAIQEFNNEFSLDHSILQMNYQVSAAQSNLDYQLVTDGVFADLYEGLKFCFDPNTPNLDEHVRDKIKGVANDVSDIRFAYLTGKTDLNDESTKQMYKEYRDILATKTIKSSQQAGNELDKFVSNNFMFCTSGDKNDLLNSSDYDQFELKLDVLAGKYNADSQEVADIKNIMKSYFAQIEKERDTKFEAFSSKYQLDKVPATDKDIALRAMYKQKFGVEFNENLAKKYSVLMKNYAYAQAFKAVEDKLSENLVYSYHHFSEKNYTKLYSTFQSVVEQLPGVNSQNSSHVVESILKNKMRAEGLEYTDGYSQEKFKVLNNMISDEIIPELRSQISNYTGFKSRSETNYVIGGEYIDRSLPEMEAELRDLGASVFGTKKDIVALSHLYSYSQETGDANMRLAGKVAVTVVVGLCTGGATAAGLSAGFGSFGVDTLDEVTGDGLEYKEFVDIGINAVADGLFASAGTGVRNFLKKWSAFGKLGKAETIVKDASIVAADTTIGLSGQCIKQYSFSPLSTENAIFCAVFSGCGHMFTKTTSAIGKISGSNVGRGIRRSIKSGDKFRREYIEEHANNFSAHIADVLDMKTSDKLQEYIKQENNLGNLNSCKREVEAMPDDNPIKNEALLAIDARIKELTDSPEKISVSVVNISDDDIRQAKSILNSKNEFLLPTDYPIIKRYISSIGDVNKLNSIVISLKQKGFDFLLPSDFRNLLDDKYAELRANKPY